MAPTSEISGISHSWFWPCTTEEERREITEYLKFNFPIAPPRSEHAAHVSTKRTVGISSKHSSISEHLGPRNMHILVSVQRAQEGLRQEC